MPKINIDEICEPIEVTVGGKTYTIEDISRDTANKMAEIGKKTADNNDTEPLAKLMAEVLGDKEGVIAKLGLRKLLALVKHVMGAITAEVEDVKNSQKADVVK